MGRASSPFCRPGPRWSDARSRSAGCALVAAHRLVTLTGVGGCGKTRLAIEVAYWEVPGYPEGVWFVDLSTIADEVALPRSGGLGSRRDHLGRGGPLEQIATYLASRQALLVLDVLVGFAYLAHLRGDEARSEQILDNSIAFSTGPIAVCLILARSGATEEDARTAPGSVPGPPGHRMARPRRGQRPATHRRGDRAVVPDVSRSDRVVVSIRG